MVGCSVHLRYTFDKVGVALSCHTLGGCVPRFEGKSKSPGPPYPQAVAVTDALHPELQVRREPSKSSSWRLAALRLVVWPFAGLGWGAGGLPAQL